jgi:hypothetical protein
MTTVSKTEARRWTDAELHKLFKDYFAKMPGVCPVCGKEVGMMMDHKGETTILSIRCRSCGNSSTVLS